MRHSQLYLSILLAASSACMAAQDQDESESDPNAAGAVAEGAATQDDESEIGVAESALVFGNDDVGVIKEAGRNCTFGQINWALDNEDSNNQNQRSGWIGATVSTHNTQFQFCIAPGFMFKQFPSSNAAHNYAVLKLGPVCPAGSVQITRRFDGEDVGNGVTSGADAGDNQLVAGNLRLNFCMFRANPLASPNFSWVDLGMPYGVLGGTSLPQSMQWGWVRTDDEDSSNNNQFYGDITGSSTFIDAAGNTKIRMARVR